MGDALGRSEPSQHHPNGCDHPYRDVEEQTFEVTGPHGTVVAAKQLTVCTQCGFVIDQPEEFPSVQCVGRRNKPYPPEGDT